MQVTNSVGNFPKEVGDELRLAPPSTVETGKQANVNEREADNDRL